MKNLDKKRKGLTPARRKKVEDRAAALIAEEMSLRELRHALKLTQENLAKALNIGQDGISRLEQRSDLLLSTLRSYVEAMGGSLSLIAKFPDRRPVILSGLAGIETERTPLRSRVRAV
jgi:transcriptional regulator with XRE-family HTH domain